MQRHHTGSGRRRAIPADWAEHHRPALAGTRDVTVELHRPAAGARGDFDRTTGRWETTTSAAYWSGPARVQIRTAAATTSDSAEQQVSTTDYAVSLAHDLVGIQLDDQVVVTSVDKNADADLTGRTLTVNAITRGSLHAERVLRCTDDLETQEPG